MKKMFAIAFISITIINPLSATIFDDIGKGIEKGAKAIKKEMEPKIKSTTVTIGDAARPPLWRGTTPPKEFTVIFQATGCAGIKEGVPLICEYKTLQQGQSTTYKWRWGQTNKKVLIGIFRNGWKEYSAYPESMLKSKAILYGRTKKEEEEDLKKANDLRHKKRRPDFRMGYWN